jgi:hypothetical protein
MNERIKQLISQCVIVEEHSNGLRYEAGFDKEKFAELIVRECVRVMYDNAIERNVPPDISQTPTHYAVAVLEHFGVEE